MMGGYSDLLGGPVLWPPFEHASDDLVFTDVTLRAENESISATSKWPAWCKIRATDEDVHDVWLWGAKRGSTEMERGLYGFQSISYRKVDEQWYALVLPCESRPASYVTSKLSLVTALAELPEHPPNSPLRNLEYQSLLTPSLGSQSRFATVNQKGWFHITASFTAHPQSSSYVLETVQVSAGNKSVDALVAGGPTDVTVGFLAKMEAGEIIQIHGSGNNITNPHISAVMVCHDTDEPEWPDYSHKPTAPSLRPMATPSAGHPSNVPVLLYHSKLTTETTTPLRAWRFGGLIAGNREQRVVRGSLTQDFFGFIEVSRHTGHYERNPNYDPNAYCGPLVIDRTACDEFIYVDDGATYTFDSAESGAWVVFTGEIPSIRSQMPLDVDPFFDTRFNRYTVATCDTPVTTNIIVDSISVSPYGTDCGTTFKKPHLHQGGMGFRVTGVRSIPQHTTGAQATCMVKRKRMPRCAASFNCGGNGLVGLGTWNLNENTGVQAVRSIVPNGTEILLKEHPLWMLTFFATFEYRTKVVDDISLGGSLPLVTLLDGRLSSHRVREVTFGRMFYSCVDHVSPSPRTSANEMIAVCIYEKSWLKDGTDIVISIPMPTISADDNSLVLSVSCEFSVIAYDLEWQPLFFDDSTSEIVPPPGSGGGGTVITPPPGGP